MAVRRGCSRLPRSRRSPAAPAATLRTAASARQAESSPSTRLSYNWSRITDSRRSAGPIGATPYFPSNRLPALLDSLATPPPLPGLKRTHDANDHRTLLTLARDPAIAGDTSRRGSCRAPLGGLPNPRFPEDHDGGIMSVSSAGSIFLWSRAAACHRRGSVVRSSGWRPTEGDIDTLTARISHVRTWTYVSHRADWVDDALGWQERTRALEDALFRCAPHAADPALRQPQGAAASPTAGVRTKRFSRSSGRAGAVMVEGERAGIFDGFRFRPDAEVETQPRRACGRPSRGRARGCTTGRRSGSGWRRCIHARTGVRTARRPALGRNPPGRAPPSAVSAGGGHAAQDRPSRSSAKII